MTRIAALLSALVLAVTACGGGDDGSRPSVAEIAAALRDADNPTGQAFVAEQTDRGVIECVARALHGSDLSDRALRAIVDGDDRDRGDGDDQDIFGSEELSGSVIACITG